MDVAIESIEMFNKSPMQHHHRMWSLWSAARGPYASSGRIEGCVSQPLLWKRYSEFGGFRVDCYSLGL